MNKFFTIKIFKMLIFILVLLIFFLSITTTYALSDIEEDVNSSYSLEFKDEELFKKDIKKIMINSIKKSDKKIIIEISNAKLELSYIKPIICETLKNSMYTNTNEYFSVEHITYGTLYDEFKKKNKIYINFFYINTPEEKEYIKKYVKTISDDIKKQTSDTKQQILLAHNFIIANFSYDNNEKIVKDYLYGFITTKKGVCSSYSRLFGLILNELNIPNKYQISNNMNHMWNCVYIDNDWYYYDLTWDDTDKPGDCSFYYYHLTKEQMSKTHDFEY